MEKEKSGSAKPGVKSWKPLAGSSSRSGSTKDENPTVEYLKKNKVPVTRENYLNLAYLGNPPKELNAEEEAMLPEELRDTSNV